MAIKYPYTDFHEMNLDWTLSTVKQASEDSQEAKDRSLAVQQQVNDFIEDLDLDDAVDQKIDEMASDGSLNLIIDPVIADEVTDWLADNIGPTTPAIDASLTVTGAGADAKVVGDLFETCLMARGTLTAADDLDAVADPGTYYVAAGDIPANAPDNVAGRILVVKSYQNSYAVDAQIYFTDSAVYYRVSKNVTAIPGAWSGITWKSLVDDATFDSVVMQRSSLGSADDMNDVTQPGLYRVSSSDGFPANLPVDQHNGTVAVFNTILGSAQCVIQVYAWAYQRPAFFIRVSKDLSNPATAWAGVKWEQIFTSADYTRTNTLDGKTLQVPLVYGSMQSTGRYGGVSYTRLRVVNSYHNLFNFQLAGHKIKFYYYNGPYDFDEATYMTNPTNFLYTTAWENIDDPVSPRPGLWFNFMVAKQGDGTISQQERDQIIANLHIEGRQDPDVFMQVQTVPPTAVDYHTLWDSLLDGSRVKRTLLGKVQNDDDYPIYAYEIHTQRNSMTGNYQNTTFNGSNEVYPRKKVLIFAGTHGNEKCTPMDVLTLAKELINGSMQDVGAMFDWYIIPIVNPWGYSHVNLDSDGKIIYRYGTVAQTVDATWSTNAGVRVNAQGLDINRDFSDVTYTDGGDTYGWQTEEAQIIKSYVLGQGQWTFFLDVHQNNQDKYDAMPHMFAMCGQAWDSNTDSGWLNEVYQTIDNACRNTTIALDNYFRRSSDRGQSMVIWDRYACDDANSSKGVATNYFGGYEVAGTGNTLNQSIAAALPITLETSELAWTYSQLSNQTNTPSVSWYNPVACTCSSTALVNVVKSFAKVFAFFPGSF